MSSGNTALKTEPTGDEALTFPCLTTERTIPVQFAVIETATAAAATAAAGLTTHLLFDGDEVLLRVDAGL